MALTITIAGVDRSSLTFLPDTGGQLAYQRQAGAIGTVQFKIYGRTGSADYRPSQGDSVVIANGGTTIFSGQISDVSEEGLTTLDTGTITTVTAQDNNRLPFQINYTKTYAANVTLKSVLQDLIASKLTVYGVTLDSSQDTGPTIAQLTFDKASGDAILNQLQTITGRPWEIDANLKLKQLAPGSVACGFSLGDNGDVMGKVKFKQTRSQNYCNRVIVVGGQNQQVEKTDNFQGDGVTTKFPMLYTFVAGRGYITVNSVYTPIGTGTAWAVVAYPQTDGTTKYQLETTGAAPASLVPISIIYTAQFPISAEADNTSEQTAHGLFEKRYEAQDCYDILQLGQLASSLLSRAIATPRVVTVSHRKGTSAIGQTVPLSFSARNISGTYMIASVGWADDVDGNLIYTISALENAVLQPNWVDYFRQGGSTASSTTGTVSAAIIPALSGTFQADVTANANNATLAASLTTWDNGSATGPALLLGSRNTPYPWVFVADPTNGQMHVRTATGTYTSSTHETSWLRGGVFIAFSELWAGTNGGVAGKIGLFSGMTVVLGGSPNPSAHLFMDSSDNMVLSNNYNGIVIVDGFFRCNAGMSTSGATASSAGLVMPSAVPSSTTNALYNNGGALTWNGTPVSVGFSGSGTANKIPLWTGSTAFGNSILQQQTYATAVNVNGGALWTGSNGAVAGVIGFWSPNVSVLGGTPTPGASILITSANHFLITNGYGNIIELDAVTTQVNGSINWGGGATITTSSNVALLNAANVFTADQKINSGATANALSLGSQAIPSHDTLNQIYVGTGFWLGQEVATGEMDIGWNAYYNSGWKARVADAAARIQIIGSGTGAGFNFLTAPSVAANATLTWTNRVSFDTLGNITAGRTLALVGTSLEITMNSDGGNLGGAYVQSYNGSYLPLEFIGSVLGVYIGGTLSTKFFASGGVGIGTTTDPGATNLRVVGRTITGDISISPSVVFTNGINTFTMTNAPAGHSGNPTGYLAVTIGGTGALIPYWT